MPKIINTLSENCDLSGKTIMPFATSGSSGISTSVLTIKDICLNADVKSGFMARANSCETEIDEWLESVGF